MSLFYSNLQGGRAGFFQFRASPLMLWLGWIVFKVSWILPPTFSAFSAASVGAFFIVVYFFNMIWIFLWHINVFNVRQKVLADFGVSDKALCDVKCSQIEGKGRKFSPIELSNSALG